MQKPSRSEETVRAIVREGSPGGRRQSERKEGNPGVRTDSATAQANTFPFAAHFMKLHSALNSRANVAVNARSNLHTCFFMQDK